mgnify:CR=1 FL=1
MRSQRPSASASPIAMSAGAVIDYSIRLAPIPGLYAHFSTDQGATWSAPVRVNDDPSIWTRMWTEQLRQGVIPYYMFVERDTGPRDYFEVPLVRAWEVYREALQPMGGLGRTVRGPSMSATPGKVCVNGVTEIAAFGLGASSSIGTALHADSSDAARLRTGALMDSVGRWPRCCGRARSTARRARSAARRGRPAPATAYRRAGCAAGGSS